MRVKFSNLNEKQQADVRASPHYANLDNPRVYVVWCDECGDFMPMSTRRSMCDVCRGRQCRNPECDAIVATRYAKFCSDTCKERERQIRRAVHFVEASKLRGQGWSIDGIAAELRVSKSVLCGLIKDGGSVGVST